MYLLCRWKPIANMVKFANTCVGTGVENWNGGNYWLGFSRQETGAVLRTGMAATIGLVSQGKSTGVENWNGGNYWLGF